jgi:hypothetical protein
LAIARDDFSIHTALESFRETLDESTLAKTLRLVSKKTIEDTLQERENLQQEDEEEEEVRLGSGLGLGFSIPNSFIL